MGLEQVLLEQEAFYEPGFVATPVKAWIRFPKRASPAGSRRQLRFMDREQEYLELAASQVWRWRKSRSLTTWPLREQTTENGHRWREILRWRQTLSSEREPSIRVSRFVPGRRPQLLSPGDA